MMDMISSPARPMDLDEDDYFPSTNVPHRSSSDDHHHHHHTPVSKMLLSTDHASHQTPPLFRIVHNPFDPPTSAHLKQRLASPSIFRALSQYDDNHQPSALTSVFDWSIEQLAELHPKKFPDENIIQIDAALFDENLMQRYQRAANEFCSSKLHLPTPAAPTNQYDKTLATDLNGYYCPTATTHPMTSPFPHFDLKASTASIFPRDFPGRPSVDFDACLMEQCGELQNTTLDTSFNNTNPSLHSSRLSAAGGPNDVSFLKRRLFEDEDDDVDLIPEDDDPSSANVTSTQKPKSPPRCDSDTEDDHRISSPSHRLNQPEAISPIAASSSSSFLFDVDCSPIRKD